MFVLTFALHLPLANVNNTVGLFFLANVIMWLLYDFCEYSYIINVRK